MMLLQCCTQCASKFGKLSNGHRTGKDKFSFQSQRRTITKNVQTSVVMYGCESWMIKKGWAPRKWCFLTVVLVKTLESPLDCKEIKQVNPKGNQSWIFIGKTDAEDETPIFWPPDGKSWLNGKDPDAGKDWRQGEKGTAEDEMVGWHHWLNGHEFEQAPGVGDGQGDLMCCSLWGRKESAMTGLNWTESSVSEWDWHTSTGVRALAQHLCTFA